MSLDAVLDGHLDTWQGLSGAETLESLNEALKPLKHVHEPAERVRTYQRFMVTVFERVVAPYIVEAWLTYGSSQVALIEYDDPPIYDLEGTLQRYGPPELILSDKRYTSGAFVREYVYARRGIVLSIAEPFASAAATERRAIHMQLFPSASVEFYITDIGTGPDMHPYSPQ